MKELKTLKDILVLDYEVIGGEGKEESAYFDGKRDMRKELREEAIKWVQEICKDGFNKCPTITINGEGGQLMKALIEAESSLVVDWIKHFFNLTEEDLK